MSGSAPAHADARELDVGRAALFGAFASALVGLYAIASAGPVGPLPILVLGAAVVVGIFRMRRGVKVASAGEEGTLRTGLPTFLIALVIVPLHGLATGSWVLAAIDLLVILQANRLLALSEGRAIGQVLLVALLMLLGAAVLTLSISFLGAVFLFCVCGTWTAIFLSIFDPGARGADRRVPRAFAALAAGAGLGVFVLTCVLFGALPRLRFQAFRNGILQAEAVSGFSEEVQLGDIGSVKRDFSPVMRVQTRQGTKTFDPRDAYWRGIALDHYERGHWNVSDEKEEKLRGVRSGAMTSFEVDLPRSRRARGRLAVEQEIALEPIDVSVLFAMPDVLSLSGDLPLVSWNSTDSLVFRARGYARTEYTVYSMPPESDERVLSVRRAIPPDGPDPRWLQIPADVRAAIAPLAAKLAGEGSDFERVYAVEAAMRGWEYSLQAPPATRSDPVVSFLLDSHRGWCEQYSSGMVLLLRSIGIPARMANGFHGGEWNEFGHYLLVRKADAHSWVEVPFDGVGWITFDPTPGRGAAEDRSFGAMQQLWDYAKRVWSQRIVTYDIFDQFALVSAAGDRAQNFSERFQRDLRRVRPGRVPRPVIAGIVLAALFGGAALLVWRRRGGRGARGGVEAAERWWARVEARMAKDGFRRARGETPRELATRAGRREWAELYYEVRFSTRAITDAARARMDEVSREL